MLDEVGNQIDAALAEQSRAEQAALFRYPEFEERYSSSDERARRQLMGLLLEDEELRLYQARSAVIDAMRHQLRGQKTRGET